MKCKSSLLLIALATLFIGQVIIVPAARGEQVKEVYAYLLNLSMEELLEVPIQSSGLFAMDWQNAPGVYYVVNKEQLDRYGFRSVGEYLHKAVPGMHIATHGNQGMTIGVRGILIDVSAKTLLLRDNLNVNTRTLVGVNGSKIATPLMGDIDRVEVALGPGAVRHGSGAINGFINLIGSSGKTKEGVRIKATYGSGYSRIFEASYGHVFSERANVFLYGGYTKSHGVDLYYTLPVSDWSAKNGVNGTPSEVFLDNAKIGKTDDDYKFTFRAQLGSEDDPIWLDFKTMLSRTTNVDPALGWYLGANRSWIEELELMASPTVRYSPFFIQYDEEFLVAPEMTLNLWSENQINIIPFYIHQRSGNEMSDELNQWIASLNITPNTAGCTLPGLYCRDDYPGYGYETHRGVTVIDNFTGLPDQSIGIGGEVRDTEFHFYDWDWTTVSAFAEYQAKWKDFTFLLGGRYDKIYYGSYMESLSNFNDGPYTPPPDDDSLTKRLAVTYHVSDKQSVKLSYQEGFRFTDKWFQHWAKHLDPQQNIAPEKSMHYELSYSANNLLNKKLDFLATFFQNTYKNTHGFYAGQLNFGNSKKEITSYGAEFSLYYRPTEQFNFDLSYSYAHPDDSYETDIKIANADNTWTRYPEHMFKFKTGYKITDAFFLGSTGTFLSPRFNKAEVTDPQVVDLFNDWDFVADLVASYQMSKRVRLTFSAKELFRKHYNQSTAYFQGTYPLDSPRAADPQFYLTLTVNL